MGESSAGHPGCPGSSLGRSSPGLWLRVASEDRSHESLSALLPPLPQPGPQPGTQRYHSLLPSLGRGPPSPHGFIRFITAPLAPCPRVPFGSLQSRSRDDSQIRELSTCGRSQDLHAWQQHHEDPGLRARPSQQSGGQRRVLSFSPPSAVSSFTGGSLMTS